MVLRIGQAPQSNVTFLLPIHCLGNGRFWNLGDAEDMPVDSFEGRFAGLLPTKPSDDTNQQMGTMLLESMGVKVKPLNRR